MQFPQRAQTHITETESWRLLQQLAPEEWIVREISERDYGIDSYIEIATKTGAITGDLISVQLKGVHQIPWNKRQGDARSAVSPRIKSSTANYWLRLPVPVFLFVADLREKNIYFATVESQLRNHFDRLSSQGSVTLKLSEKADLRSEQGRKVFQVLVARERWQPQFVFQVTMLLSSVQTFADFILDSQGYDGVLTVDDERHLQFRAIYGCLETCAYMLRGAWNIESLRDLYLKDREQLKDDYSFLHEFTLSYALRKMQAVLPQLVRLALELVLNKQPEYWRQKDIAFYLLCKSGHSQRALALFEERCKPPQDNH